MYHTTACKQRIYWPCDVAYKNGLYYLKYHISIVYVKEQTGQMHNVMQNASN